MDCSCSPRPFDIFLQRLLSHFGAVDRARPVRRHLSLPARSRASSDVANVSGINAPTVPSFVLPHRGCRASSRNDYLSRLSRDS